jgi:hypothetical protein
LMLVMINDDDDDDDYNIVKYLATWSVTLSVVFLNFSSLLACPVLICPDEKSLVIGCLINQYGST